ncbi:MAG: EpsG family protein [Rhodothermus sp.]|nr:EpsG family protein [Rhodothermus sp.]
MIYLIGWLLVYYYLVVRLLVRHRVRLLALGVIVLLGALAIFRGAVGTDTFSYEKAVIDSERMAGIEPGFWLLTALLHSLLQDPVLVIRGVACVFTVLLCWFVWKADDDELFFVMAFVVPVFFYAFSMNVLRMGLASVIFLLALQLDRRQQLQKALLLAFVSILFHYSVVFVILYLWLIDNKLSGKGKVVGIIGIVLFVVLLILFNETYFEIKLKSYVMIEPPGMLSGLSRIILCMVLLAGVVFSSLPPREKHRLFWWTLLFMGMFWGITRISYAGLRLLDLLIFTLAVAIMRSYGRTGQPVDRIVKASWLLAGLLGAAAMYRNMLQERFWSPSPWLPYHTLFER